MIKAIHNNVVLQKKVKQRQKGIYMPSMGDDSFIVLNVGPEVSTIKVGNEVIVDKNPKQFKLGMNEYYITSIENMIAIVEENHE